MLVISFAFARGVTSMHSSDLPLGLHLLIEFVCISRSLCVLSDPTSLVGHCHSNLFRPLSDTMISTLTKLGFYLTSTHEWIDKSILESIFVRHPHGYHQRHQPPIPCSQKKMMGHPKLPEQTKKTSTMHERGPYTSPQGQA
jgi:hypothetical protein